MSTTQVLCTKMPTKLFKNSEQVLCIYPISVANFEPMNSIARMSYRPLFNNVELESILPQLLYVNDEQKTYFWQLLNRI